MVKESSSTIRKAGVGGAGVAVTGALADVGMTDVLARGWANSAGKDAELEEEEEADVFDWKLGLEAAAGPATKVSMLVLRVLSRAMVLEFNDPDGAMDLFDADTDMEEEAEPDDPRRHL